MSRRSLLLSIRISHQDEAGPVVGMSERVAFGPGIGPGPDLAPRDLAQFALDLGAGQPAEPRLGLVQRLGLRERLVQTRVACPASSDRTGPSRAADDLSSTSQRLTITLRLPARKNAWAKPTNPSPPLWRPRPLRQALERNQLGIELPSVHDLAGGECAIEDRRIERDRGGRVGQLVLREQQPGVHGREVVDLTMGGQVNHGEPAELSARAHRVEGLFARI